MKILILMLITLSLHSDIREELFTLYQQGNFKDVCKIGFKHIQAYKRDETFVNLYAFSCLKSDYIDRLSIPVTLLKYTKEARANAAYFATILMQKKLLYHALIDDYDLSSLKLPSTDYVLSKVFDYYAKLGEHKAKKVYIFKDDKDSKISYKLYILREAHVNKIVIEEFYDTIAVKRHVYW